MCVTVVLALLVSMTVATELVYEIVEAKEGSNTKMICNLSPMHSPDKISLILWYRGDSPTPFYKYDLRTGRPERWSEPSLGSKYVLQMLNDEKAELSVGAVTLLDEDTYHCRVEFFRSSSTITHVNLTIIDAAIAREKYPTVFNNEIMTLGEIVEFPDVFVLEYSYDTHSGNCINQLGLQFLHPNLLRYFENCVQNECQNFVFKICNNRRGILSTHVKISL